MLDEMHAGRIAGQLRGLGFDVVAIQERPDLRGAADEDVLAAATSEDRALVTENVKDFAPLARQWATDRRAHSGIVFTHPRRFDRTSLYPGGLVTALQACLGQPPVGGESWTWWL